MKFFADRRILNRGTTLTGHNEQLASDTLTTIALNADWRPIVAAALEFYLTEFIETASSYDNDDLLSGLLEDLYTAETFAMQKQTSGNQILSSDKTTSSASFVDVPQATFSFVAAASNCILRWNNIALQSSGAAQNSVAQAAISGETPDNQSDAQQFGVNSRQLQCAAIFSGLTIGVSYTAKLQFKTSAGTATISANSTLGWTLEEWD